MGLASSQVRLLSLTARLSSLSFTGQQINEARIRLANQANNLFTSLSNLDPDSTESRQLQARASAIQKLDQTLELQLKRVDTQYTAAQTEVDQVKKVIDKDIERTFKTFA